jgi:S1-C subfamily serine protease
MNITTRRHAARALRISAALLLGTGMIRTLNAQDLNSQERQRLYYEVKPAVVLVWASASAQINVAGPTAASATGIQWPTDPVFLTMNAEISTFGSGFLLSPDGYLATNAHVIQIFHEQNEQQLQAELFFNALEASGFFEHEAVLRGGGGLPLTHDKKVQLATRLLPYATFRVEKDLDVYLQNWRRYPAEVKEYSPPINPFTGRLAVPGITWATGKDVAILKIEGRDLPTMQIGDSNRQTIGDNVSVAGYPAVASFNDYLDPRAPMQASFTRGQISSLKVDVKGSSLVQIDAAISSGSSGGAVLSDRGEVVGMATMGADVQGFNFAVPTSVITEFIRASGVTPQPSLFDRIWRQGLTHYYTAESATGRTKRSEYQAAIDQFDEALRLLPDLPDAVALRQEALRRRDESPNAGPSPLPIIGIAVALGALLIGAGVMMRRKGAGVAIAHGGRNGGGRLVVTAGPLQGNQFAIGPKGLRIGRDPTSCEIVLTEATVSREHAMLSISGSGTGGLTIRNLSGTNSTYVNDRAVQEAALKPGDRIKIGSSVLSFEAN